MFFKHVELSDGAYFYKKYFEYLNENRHKIPTHVYSFASNIKFYSLDDKSSLHDAWLNSLIVNEIATGSRSENREIEIKMQFLAPYHDRLTELSYKKVSMFDLKTPTEFVAPPFINVGHGDLLTHEVSLSESQGKTKLIHKLLFSRGSTFHIECEDIIHAETILTK